MKKIILSEEMCQEIHELYKSGLSRKGLQEKYNISGTVIIRIFKEHNWEFRPPSCGKYLVNEDYFDEINTLDKAYILGLLLADGCNHEEEHTISLELQEIDKEIVDHVNKIININRPIYYYNYTGKYNHVQGTYKMLCCNEHISKRLHDLGVVKNKSLILDYPNYLDQNLIPSMLRGYIDGDGWITKKTIGLMSSDKFCYAAQEQLKNDLGINCKVIDMKRHYNEHTKTLYVCNQDDKIKLAHYLYSDGNLKLQRKYDKCLQYNYL